MSKAVVYTGADFDNDSDDSDVDNVGEWADDEDVADVTVADGVTEIKEYAFENCKGLTNLSFLRGSAVKIVGREAFCGSGVNSLLGVEGVRKVGPSAFHGCRDLRTIEGLDCEEMGWGCFAFCTLLSSMKGWPASMTVIPYGTFWGCTGMTTVGCDISHVTSIGVHVDGQCNAFYNCTSLLPPSLSKKNADPAAVLAHLKRKAFLETPAGAAELAVERENAARAAEFKVEYAARTAKLEIENAARAAELEVENAARAAELETENAARAAEDSLLAELDAEDAAKKEGKKKKKKKKKNASGKKGAQQAEPVDWRTDFQRYVQSDMMRGVDERKRQRNLEEAARIMAAHEQKIAALPPSPSLDPAPPTPPAPPDALAETMEDIEAQIAALGLPPDFDPAPAPAAPHPAAPDAFMEALLGTAAPLPPPQQSLVERVRSLHLVVCGAEMPAGMGMAAAVALVEEGLLGGVLEGGVLERVGELEKSLYG
ncbi:hypothetical protein TeGR_g4384 [Tetraparma gracilis]|uniref:Uncharacterized protein n=1 Tax=Tetraparma gracilis TaxID=2962635 RepID=A0ABQ6MGH3_9STRA|nr:hypothetical protein TeGR_g4384 [Tetraparma gracilis]